MLKNKKECYFVLSETNRYPISYTNKITLVTMGYIWSPSVLRKKHGTSSRNAVCTKNRLVSKVWNLLSNIGLAIGAVLALTKHRIVLRVSNDL